MNSYHFFVLFGLIFASYLFSNYLVNLKKISLITNRRIWNIILLISFLISGVLGLILAMFIDLKWSILWYQPVLWLHVEFGIIMALVAVFHFLWHLSYYISIFKKR